MQVKNINNEAEDKKRKFNLQIDRKIEIEKSETFNFEPKAMKYKKKSI